ncbi:hypothetical protein [Legionella rowbothamii]|uniref:hypothetical protein n=1 Tax=Legionella rowbothamii TaxID=96229 RepID=UPI001056B440|nr:hypothetical protein [Legionella rowbothamii]
MKTLCSILDHKSAEEKFEFLYKLFEILNTEVKQILSFGPSNTVQAQKANDLYHFLKDRKNFFPIQLHKDEFANLPTVFAQNLLYANDLNKADKANKTDKANIYEHYLQLALYYGTGTCEFFSIVGAYFLAKKYDINLSIETIFSDESHTYIRLHTNPEYILDFWSEMVCEYDDEVTWLEVLGPNYQRKDATFKTELILNSNDLIAMGDRVFTEQNARIRLEIQHIIENKVANFLSSNSGISSEKKQFSFLNRFQVDEESPTDFDLASKGL